MNSEKDVKQELLDAAISLLEKTRDYATFANIFSDDPGRETLADINQLMKRVISSLRISNIKKVSFPSERPVRPINRTFLVKVRPCGDEYKNKTYLGFLIGDAALSSSIKIEDMSLICSFSFFNPMIYIPERGTLVYGVESWWHEISSIAELKDITDEDIDNVWYIQLAKKLLASNIHIGDSFSWLDEDAEGKGILRNVKVADIHSESHEIRIEWDGGLASPCGGSAWVRADELLPIK